MECPHCGGKFRQHKNPFPTVDVIIEINGGIVLIQRKNPPQGWALPGGFVDYGESLEVAAVREAKEETGLDITLTGQLGSYSDPSRDPRFHTITTVFTATADGIPKGADDADKARIFKINNLPQLVFDHQIIINDFLKKKV